MGKIKPPIGIMPRYLYVETRIGEIKRAMIRYASAEKAIPGEWKSELTNLLLVYDKIKNNKNTNQFDFFAEKYNLQKEIKDKIMAFLSKCGNNKIEFQIEPRYIQGTGSRDHKLIGIDFKIIITS